MQLEFYLIFLGQILAFIGTMYTQNKLKPEIEANAEKTRAEAKRIIAEGQKTIALAEDNRDKTFLKLTDAWEALARRNDLLLKEINQDRTMLKQKIDELTEKIKQLEAKMLDDQKTILDLQAEIKTLQLANTQKDSRIAELQTSLDNAKSESDSFLKRLEELEKSDDPN